uniref:DUF4939 domain-containing protein n=1 Tax=Monopterus albus TaxID=43700 RepID=A0A3Q3KB44_MONAL
MCLSGFPRRDQPIPEPDVDSVDKFRGFLLQCRLVFDQQPWTFRTDREKICYVINRLCGKALTWAEAVDSSGVLIGWASESKQKGHSIPSTKKVKM